MATVTVSTKAELENAVNSNAEKIIIRGEIAETIIKNQKRKAVSKKIGIGSAIIAGMSVAAGIATAPFTAGTSAALGIANAVMTTAGGTKIALSTVEFIAFCGTALSALGITAGIIKTITKNYNIKINSGSTSVECTRK